MFYSNFFIFIFERKSAKITIFCFLCFIFSSQLYSQTSDTVDYYPLKFGNIYYYNNADFCPPDIVLGNYLLLTRRIFDSTIYNNKKYYVTRVVMRHIKLDTARVDSNNNLILLEQCKERVFYKFNAKVGETWNYIDTISGKEFNSKITLKSRTDTVRGHAGTFTNCLRFDFQDTRAFSFHFTDWIAPNIGFVYRCIEEPYGLYEAVINGKKYPITSVKENKDTKYDFVLQQNYPNPFNPETNIKYEVYSSKHVNLFVYDILGRKVITLVDEYKHPGSYEIKWNGKDENGNEAPSGIYFLKLKTKESQHTKLLLKIK
jgi:hypothetical protein